MFVKFGKIGPLGALFSSTQLRFTSPFCLTQKQQVSVISNHSTTLPGEACVSLFYRWGNAFRGFTRLVPSCKAKPKASLGLKCVSFWCPRTPLSLTPARPRCRIATQNSLTSRERAVFQATPLVTKKELYMLHRIWRPLNLNICIESVLW